MELLFSNFPPVKTTHKSFYDQFYADFAQANCIDIAVAYITAEAISTLKKTLEINTEKKLNLIIGMHYFEKFTKLEYLAALDLSKFLKEEKLGTVKLVNTFKYHGKLYSYSNNSGAFSSIIGSDNLSSILDNKLRVYESSVRITEPNLIKDINQFISQLIEKSSTDIDNIEITNFKEPRYELLENHSGVEKVSPQLLTDCLTNLTSSVFNISIKASSKHTKSNINAFHGKGRESTSTGLIKPRHWYEVELIVDSSTTSSLDYPKEENNTNIFTVITDDSWKFKCKVSGDYNKNFRSESDLKILGKWLKGRLENAGVLKIGELVTEKTLNDYGRNNFTLTKTKIPNTWYLDFGVRR